jgi:hypothetical protein
MGKRMKCEKARKNWFFPFLLFPVEKKKQRRKNEKVRKREREKAMWLILFLNRLIALVFVCLCVCVWVDGKKQNIVVKKFYASTEKIRNFHDTRGIIVV